MAGLCRKPPSAGLAEMTAPGCLRLFVPPLVKVAYRHKPDLQSIVLLLSPSSGGLNQHCTLKQLSNAIELFKSKKRGGESSLVTFLLCIFIRFSTPLYYIFLTYPFWGFSCPEMKGTYKGIWIINTD
jgi:hypothetical protein